MIAIRKDKISSVDPVEIENKLTYFPEGLAFPWESVTCYSRIDAGGLSLVAAGAHHGKSTFLINLLIYFLRNYTGSVVVWSGEMVRMLIYARIISILASSEYSKTIDCFRYKKYTKEIDKARLQISKWSKKLFLVDALEDEILTVEDLYELVRIISQEQSVAAVIIDYVQQLSINDDYKYATREQVVTYIARKLHYLGYGENIPVIAAAQISRANRAYKEKVKITDIRESGGMEQYAQAVWGLWNSQIAGKHEAKASAELPEEGWYWTEDGSRYTDSAVARAVRHGGVLLELSIMKHRLRGQAGKTIPLLLYPETGSITSMPALSKDTFIATPMD